MDNMNISNWKYKSRHPRILYWFWNSDILVNDKYISDLHYIAGRSSFNTVILSAREGVSFYDPSVVPYLKNAVKEAHKLGLKIILQLWVPRNNGIDAIPEITDSVSVSLVSETERIIEDGSNGEVSLFCASHSVRAENEFPWIRSRLLGVYIFRKMGEGIYDPDSFQDVTGQAQWHVENHGIQLHLSLPGKENYTVFAMAENYYAYADLFSDFFPDQFCAVMDRFADDPFDSLVLDEFKHIPIKREGYLFRDRIAGKAFTRAFEQSTGYSLTKTLLEMRYVPEGQDSVRIAAINRYFAFMRQGPSRIEHIVAEIAQKYCGPDAFLGLHNTFHNSLQCDEIWATGCQWWETPRKYAQTDEDITLPVRMGISCQCQETIHYDMYYTRTAENFYRKGLEDARFGGRIHYHAMNDRDWGVNVGEEDIMNQITRVEKKIALLDWFDGPMPKMDLLIVFGMPALCNWYPDIQARNHYDINGKLQIQERADALWKSGCRCALAPSEAVDDGRIKLTSDGFCYGKHHFSSMLFLYPEYSRNITADFFEKAIAAGSDLRVIGDYHYDFDGQPASPSLRRKLRKISLAEDDDIAAEMNLPLHPIIGQCLLEDGSMVYSSWNSLKGSKSFPISFQCADAHYEGSYIGTAAIKCAEDGTLERFVCGGFTELKKNGEVILSASEPCDICWEKDTGMIQVF